MKLFPQQELAKAWLHRLAWTLIPIISTTLVSGCDPALLAGGAILIAASMAPPTEQTTRKNPPTSVVQRRQVYAQAIRAEEILWKPNPAESSSDHFGLELGEPYADVAASAYLGDSYVRYGQRDSQPARQQTYSARAISSQERDLLSETASSDETSQISSENPNGTSPVGRAMQAYRQVRWQQTVEIIAHALDSGGLTTGESWDVYVLLGAIEYQNGNVTTARRHFIQAYRHDSRMRSSVDLFPPQILEFYTDVNKRWRLFSGNVVNTYSAKTNRTDPVTADTSCLWLGRSASPPGREKARRQYVRTKDQAARTVWWKRSDRADVFSSVVFDTESSEGVGSG